MFYVKYSIYRLAVVYKCYRAVVLWNVTSLHLGKLVVQGYKVMVWYFISSLMMDFWSEETLNCLKNNNLKVDFVGNGKERLFIFVL